MLSYHLSKMPRIPSNIPRDTLSSLSFIGMLLMTTTGMTGTTTWCCHGFAPFPITFTNLQAGNSIDGSIQRGQRQTRKDNTFLHMNWFTNTNNKNDAVKNGRGGIGTNALDVQNFKKTGQHKNHETKIKIIDYVGSGSYGTVHLCKMAPKDIVETKDNECTDVGAVASVAEDTFLSDNMYIAKRAWTLKELISKQEQEQVDNNGGKETTSQQELQDRAKRCEYYLKVEQHCLTKVKNTFQKMGGESISTSSTSIPNLLGRFRDEDEGLEWLVFDVVRCRSGTDSTGIRSGTSENAEAKIEENVFDAKYNIARSLKDVMELDWVDQHRQKSPIATQEFDDNYINDDDNNYDHHHLYMIQKEMNLAEETTFGETLDIILTKLLEVIEEVHKANVVHRDIKPDNLLIDGEKQSFVLIDFGSAADMDPDGTKKNLFGFGGRVGLEDGSRVAVSPIYAAPEMFVNWDKSPLNFDSFSVALVFCQLLFNLLDERTDAAFHQQLEVAKYDLDSWLERELSSTLRPDGLDDALFYLGERAGLWNLLKDMFHPNPERRVSSTTASKRFQQILSNLHNGVVVSRKELDGPYFDSVVSSLELCEIPGENVLDRAIGRVVNSKPSPGVLTPVPETDFVIPRPLHFVATFDRSKSLGLILSEVDESEEDENDDEEAKFAWKRATKNASRGEVFVRGIVDGGQAETMGIFEIGDRVRGVGEIPLVEGGFERVVSLLGSVPQSSKTVRIHFDRKSIGSLHPKEKGSPHLAKIVGQGAWSSKGRRKAQEDAFVLHEIHNGTNKGVLMAGVFDGHGGVAASKTASQVMPSLLGGELSSKLHLQSETKGNISEALKSAWDITCDTYRDGCSLYGECVADYDPREGILLASTGSRDLVAGTTAAVAVLSTSPDGTDELSILNCGDSRVLVVGKLIETSTNNNFRKASVIHFATRDHSPGDELEAERLRKGKEAGLDYSQPQCSVSTWRIKVGDYQYAISRSLEGEYATSKGIVSEADVTTLSLSDMLTERKTGILIIASDGLFEVLDNEQVGREALKMRESGMNAEDTAKNLCGMALEKSTSDNVSTIVIHLE